MDIRTRFAALALATLTGCGGGSLSIGLGAGYYDYDYDEAFVIWRGNSSGDLVVDANNDAFAFYADSGCLYNPRTGRENRDFCLTSSSGSARYGTLPVRIVNVRAVTGICIAALIDEATSNFIDIGLDAVGREVVFVTALRPDFCVV